MYSLAARLSILREDEVRQVCNSADASNELIKYLEEFGFDDLRAILIIRFLDSIDNVCFIV